MVLSHTCLPVASLSHGTPPEIRTQKLTGLNRYCIPVPTMGYNSYKLSADHPIATLSAWGTSIVYLLAEFEPLTMALYLILMVLVIGLEPTTY